jgi:hypothetical protein
MTKFPAAPWELLHILSHFATRNATTHLSLTFWHCSAHVFPNWQDPILYQTNIQSCAVVSLVSLAVPLDSGKCGGNRLQAHPKGKSELKELSTSKKAKYICTVFVMK